ncbi:MAG TPA: hypothetical protein VKT30_15310 [Caulobacteraceae bacterium]|nr:hypothetical protein [Caulobacteraceae bacterium]
MDVEQRLKVQEALLSALIVHAANRGMIADMLEDARTRLSAGGKADDQPVRAGVVARLESILSELDKAPGLQRRR